MGSPLFVGVWCGNFTIRQRWGESIFLTSKKIEISKVTNYEKCSINNKNKNFNVKKNSKKRKKIDKSHRKRL
jgi:hypothetical protein